MKTLLSLLTILTAFLLLTLTVFAATSPTITEPANSTTISDSSPKLAWSYSDNCPSGNVSCFLVEVDNSSTFDSPEKSTYTNNLSYSPSLSEGTWYWRVKAKDSTNSWSEWATSVFTIASQTPAPSPSSANPTISPSPTTTPTPTSSANQPVFTISNIPSNLDINSSTQIQISLTLPSNPNSTFYLKGAFIHPGSTNYFGLTKINGSWVKNSSAFSTQYQISTDSNGNWQGNIDIMPDATDSGYTGSDNYQFKVARYTSSGGGPTWSNEATISLSGSITPSSTPNPSTKTPSPSPSPSAKPLTSTSANPNIPTSVSEEKIPSDDLKIASVAGIATVAALSIQTPSSTSYNINWLYLGSGVLILIGTISAIVVKYNSKIEYKKWLSHLTRNRLPKNLPPQSLNNIS